MSANRLPADAPHGFGGIELDRSRPIRFRLNGRAIEGFAGDTVLSATLAAGIQIAGRHGDVPLALDERGAPQIALVRSANNLRQGLPMDRTPALDGVDFVTLGTRRDVIAPGGMLGKLRNLIVGPARTLNLRLGDGPSLAPPWQSAVPDEQLAADLVVVGAGVAGLSAAAVAVALGKSVILIERTQSTGGAIRFFGSVDNEESPDDALARLGVGLEGKDSLTLLTRTEVFLVQGNRVLAHQVTVEGGTPRGRVLAITAGSVVIATGALERLPVFPGNRSPGVVGSLAAFQRAERFGVWAGRRALINTPHSASYRLALYAQDAGVEVQRIVDTRINPHSRYIDFCKATGVTLASGLIAAEVLTLKRNLPGLRVAFAVAIDEITQDAEPLETDQLIAAGGWQPDIALWLAAGGTATWDASNRWLAPRGTLEHVALAGSAAGYRSSTACIASGKAAVLRLFGKPAPPVEDKAIDAIFESPDAPTPIAPFRVATRGTAYLDRGWTLITRRAAAASRRGVSQLAVHPVALSLSDIAASVAIGAVNARDAASIAAERCTTGGDIADTGWRVARAVPDPGPIPPPPAFLTGRFGPKPQLCVIAVSDSRFFEPGCLIFANSDATDLSLAIGVIYAAAPGGRSGGLALLATAPTALDTTLFVRDTSGAVPVKVMERLRA